MDPVRYMTQASAADALGWRIDRICHAVARGQLDSIEEWDPVRGRVRRYVARHQVDRLRRYGRLPGYRPHQDN